MRFETKKVYLLECNWSDFKNSGVKHKATWFAEQQGIEVIERGEGVDGFVFESRNRLNSFRALLSEIDRG